MTTHQTDIKLDKYLKNNEVNINDYTVTFGVQWKDIIYLPFYRISIYGFTFVCFVSIQMAMFVLTFHPVGSYYDDYFVTIATILEVIYSIRTGLAILHRIFRDHRCRKIYQPEPIYLFIIDVITLIPVAPYCQLINYYDWYNPIDHRIGDYYSFVLKLPRIIRLFFFYKISYNDLALHPRIIYLTAHVMLSTIFIMVIGSLYYLIYYYNEDIGTWADSYPDLRRSNITFKTPIICLLHAGGFFYKDSLNKLPWYSWHEMNLAISSMMLGYACHYVLLMAHLIAVYVQLMRFKHTFEWRLAKASFFTKLLDFDQSLQDAINTYYRTIWNTRDGYVEQPELVSLFPLQLRTEIAMDLYFDAIRHAKIFHDINESSKKELSLLFQTEIYIPGQLMFQKDKIKSKLIYLHSGIVEVMSNENRDSPVLSFSPGTILGEISCLIPYVCAADIRCSTVCVGHILSHPDLKGLLAKDIALDNSLKQLIVERITYARNKLQRLHRLEQPISHIYWIKNRWRTLSGYKGKENMLQTKLTLYYCSRYLSLLVLSTYYELRVHSICIRGKCSFVMEPDSSFRKFLDIFCLVCVVMHFFITFPFLIFDEQLTMTMQAFLTLFDFVYLLDIYFQAITAVRAQNVFISKPMDILLYRCKQFGFLLDLFASIPYDYLAMLMDVNAYYVGMCRIPKFIKLYKLVKFFTGNELLLKVSTNTMRIMQWMAFHSTTILVFTCLVYTVTCFNNQCIPTGWLSTFKEKNRNESGLNPPGSDFVISLIYTTSLYLQLKIIHVQSPVVHELLLQSVVCIIGFYCLALTVVQLSGSIVLENYPRFLYMYNLNFFETFLHSRPELRKYRLKMNEYTTLQWFYSSGLQYNDISTLMNHKSKFVNHKITHDFMIQILRKTEIFCYMSDPFLELLASYFNVYVIPAGHILQKPDHSAADLYVMIDGYCKVRSYAPEDSEKQNVLWYQKYDTFPIVGFFQNVNSFLLVECYTAVKVFSINYHNFLHCCKAQPKDGNILLDAIQAHLAEHKNLIMRIVHLPLLHYPEPRVKSEADLVKIFGYKEENEITTLQWHQMVKSKFIESLFNLFLNTYDPYGRGYLYYEIFRSVLIMIEMMVLYMSMHRFIRLHILTEWINTILFIFHIVDFYIRIHVQYFTETGIRVTAVKATMYYYFNRSCCIDIISALPYERMQVYEIFRNTHKNSMNQIFSLIIQPLKLYRPFSLLAVARQSFGIHYHNTILLCSHTVAMLIFYSEFSALTLAFTCTLDDDWNWECPSDCWLNYVLNSKYWRDNKLLYARSYYEVIISRVIRSSRYFTYHDFIIFLLMSVSISIITIWYLSSVIGYTAFSTKFLVNFQDRVNRYNHMATRLEFPNALRKELKDHYKFLFRKKHTDQQTDQLMQFYPALREALQFTMYVPTLKAARIFCSMSDQSYRFIVPYISEQYYIMHATIICCNDIESMIYIVKKGHVEVLVADQPVAVLGVGGMFGCFKATGVCRMTITVVAKVHADLLVMDTVKFLSLIKSNQLSNQEMRQADIANVEFFEEPDSNKKVSFAGTIINKFNRCTMKNILMFRHIIDGRNKFIKFYAYFSEMHMAPWVAIVTLNYIMFTDAHIYQTFWFWLAADVWFLIDMYLAFRVGIKDDESGLMITSPSKLARLYLKSMKFYVDVFCIIPFYMFRQQIQIENDGLLVLNKAFRILKMIIYYQQQLHTRYLPTHIRFTFLCYMLFFSLCLTCFGYWMIDKIFFGSSLSKQEVVGVYTQVISLFNTVGLHGPAVDDYLSLIYVSAAVILCIFLFVIISAGFCKLAVMVLYSDMEFRRSVITFKTYCENEFVSKPIVNQCFNYLTYLYVKHGAEQFPSLILQSPNYIVEAHMLHMCEKLVFNHKLFRFAHHDFMRQLIRYMKYEFFMPGFTIVEIEDTRKRMYFIADGTVISISQSGDESSRYKLLQKGACFGEIQAITGLRYNKTYKALTPVQLFEVKTDEWAYLMKWFPATAKSINDALHTK